MRHIGLASGFLSVPRRNVRGMATTIGFAVFDTTIGPCAVSWGDAGITGVWLPGTTAEATRRQVLRRHPQAAELPLPDEVATAIDGISRLLAGDDVDLSDVRLDLDDVPEFQRALYAVMRTLPRGVTMTYGELAARVGAPGAAQAVGQAMGHNPCPIVIPCHRVVAAGGGNGGFSAPGGVDTKLRLLAIEGATLF
jgi:methylated-DNA-[protein]-cysteine S-methyltransferase